MEQGTVANAAAGGANSSPRAGDVKRSNPAMSISVPHAQAVIVLGALGVLILIRMGFAGALGD